MMRPLVALLVLAAAFTGSGQSCFRVVEADGDEGLSGCAVWCANGEGPWYTAADGRVCIPAHCDSVRIEKPGFRTIEVDVMVAEARGRIGLPPEAVSTLLKEVVIEHWPRVRDRHAVASMGTLDSTVIAGFERSSLRGAAQWVPGVQWDERGHGCSARLSIRGSLLRSPYGVRGVKVYWGPFPLTLADGSTPLELLDPLLVGSLDIVRSVGSPMFGSAPSGLLLGAPSFRSARGSDGAIEATGGSFGYSRLAALARSNKGGTLLTAGIVRQRNTGYREQESSARDLAFISSLFTFKQSTTRVFLTWQGAEWDLPGSVDSLTAANDPQAARPYSVLLDARVEKEQLMAGLANELRVGEALRIRSGVHAQMIDKTNPYGTSVENCGYKEETVRAAGARLSIGSDQLFTLRTAWDLGMEALYERDHLRELAYVDGVQGDIRINGDTRVANLNAFATTSTRLGRATTFHLGVGMERTDYEHQDEVSGLLSEQVTEPVVLPYAGLEYTVKNGPLLHVRYATSVSRPTIWELLGTDGTADIDLRPEEVREAEFGISTSNDTARRNLRLSFYTRDIDRMIVAEETIEGTSYANSGDANITGVEFSADQRFRLSARSGLSASANFSYQRGTMPGPIPGMPEAMGGLQLIYQRRSASSLGVGARAMSEVQGSSEGGTVGGYVVLHARAEHRFTWGTSTIGIFLHCENLLDARYTSWVQVNDPGGRYYNPAPARSIFFGARLTFGSSSPGLAD